MTGRFAGERVVIIGAGVAGVAAAEAFVAEGAQVLLAERGPVQIAERELLRTKGVDVRTGAHRPDDLEGATLVLASPGVPPSAEVLGWARSRGIPVWGELELGARLARVPYLAVTGTNGKTTTTGMLTSILGAAGLDAVACGNIGYPFTTATREQRDALVVEVSSFQLATTSTFHPQVSVLLNLAPDHLDWHVDLDGYAASKARVFAAQDPSDVHVGNRDDEAAAAISMTAPCPVVWFRAGAPSEGEVGFVEGDLVSRIDGQVHIGPPPGIGPAARSNAAAAAACALVFGLDAEAVRAGLAAFTPAAHRGEEVAVIDGVRFLDDSKATNVHAALAAIDAVHDAVLIAGGRAKGQDLAPLASRAGRLVAVVAIGESADEVAEAFDDLVPVHRAASIEEAVGVAMHAAVPGGVVLLAPACASWDQFRDYGERGDRFAAAARALAEVRG